MREDMRPVVYQLFVRHFSNEIENGVDWGTAEQNGCGKFNDITEKALRAIAGMGVTHLWLTGVLRHATQTAYDGLPADPACIVKGIAGSPYAVTDYFDTDPDLAEDTTRRMDEFRALLKRVRGCGMIPIIDFIPNHVSRNYRSAAAPQYDFGIDDNRSVFFASDNSFYYLEPCNSDVVLKLPEGEFGPEHGHGRVTGNNAAIWEPGVYDWYETVKLNYGCDYRNGAHAAAYLPGVLSPLSAVPQTWRIMDSVLAYWQGLGVGGFRCDMAHMVPMQFWRWVIANSRLRDASAFFMAEAYNDHMKLTPGDVHEALLSAGFNGVYDSESYRALRNLYEGNAWANDLDCLNNERPLLYTGGVRYLENHDEPRMAAEGFWGNCGERIARAAMVAQFAAGAGPILFYNGQETAERADGPRGFGGDNGRTSIFDYTCLPRLQKWCNHGRFDGGRLSADEAALRDFTARLLPLMQHPALSKGRFYGLNWANLQTEGFGRLPGENVSGHMLYAFLRDYRKAKSTVLCVCNFSPDREMHTRIHIPEHAQEWAGRKKNGTHRFTDLMNRDAEQLILDADVPATLGIPVTVPPGGALLLEWQ